MPEPLRLSTYVYWKPRTGKDGITDKATGSYVHIGTLGKGGVVYQPKSTIVEHFGPAPGAVDRRIWAEVSQFVQDFEIKVQNVSPLAWALTFGASMPSAGSSVDMVPGSKPAQYGWLRLQGYDVDNALRITTETYGIATVDSVPIATSDFTEFNIKFMEIYTALAIGNVKNLI